MNKRIAIFIDLASIISLLFACHIILGFKNIEVAMFLIFSVTITMIMMIKNIKKYKFIYNFLTLLMIVLSFASIAFIIYCIQLELYTYFAVFLISGISLIFILNFIVDIKMKSKKLSLGNSVLQLISIIIVFISSYAFSICVEVMYIGKLLKVVNITAYCFLGIYLLLLLSKLLHFKNV